MNINLLFQDIDQRPAKHGWLKGDYFSTCRNCNNDFIGAKGSYNCADCAYDFDDQLEYESLWQMVGYAYSANYVYKKVFGNKI